MEKLRIRRLEEAEVPVSAAIIRESFADVAERFGLTQDNCPGNGAFLSNEKLMRDMRRGVAMYGAFTQGRQIGFVAVKARDARVYYLEKLAVLPAYRHKGWGKALLDCASCHVREAGGEAISIGIIAAHTQLKQWYAGYGFVEMGTREFSSLPFLVCYMEICLKAETNAT